MCATGEILSPAEELENVTYVHPYANLLSRATWSWLTPILRLGYKKTLQLPDLGTIPRVNKAVLVLLSL